MAQDRKVLCTLWIFVLQEKKKKDFQYAEYFEYKKLLSSILFISFRGVGFPFLRVCSVCIWHALNWNYTEFKQF